MLIIAIIGFIKISIVVNTIGIEQYGVYLIFLLFTYKGFLGVFLFALQDLTIKLVSEDKIPKHILNTFLFSSFVIATFLSILGIIFINLFTLLYFEQSIQYILLFSLYMQLPLLIFKSALMGEQNFKLLKLIEVIIASLNVLFIIIGFYFFEESVNVLVYSFFIVLLIEFLMLFIYFKFIRKIISKKFINKKIFYIKKDILKQLSLIKLSGVVSNQGDRIIIIVFLSPASLGIYDIITKIPFLLKNILSVINTVIMPLISNLSVKNNEKIASLYNQGFDLLIFIYFPIIVILSLNANNILKVWLGEDFTQYSTLLILFLFWNFINPLLTFGWTFIVAIGKKLKILAYVSYFTTIFKFVLLLFFIKFYTLYGVAYASIISLGIATIILNYIYVKKFKMSIYLACKNIILKLVISVFVGASLFELISGVMNNELLIILSHGILTMFLSWIIMFYFTLKDTNKILIRNKIEDLKRLI